MKQKKRTPFIVYPAIGLSVCILALVIVSICIITIPHEYLPEIFINVGNGKPHIIPMIVSIGLIFALLTWIGLFVSEIEGYDVFHGKWRKSKLNTCPECGEFAFHHLNGDTMDYSCEFCQHKS